MAIRKAVILAAGRGTRLNSYTADVPKCLLPLGKSVLLDYQLTALEAVGVDTVILSAGFGIEKVERFLETRSGTARVIVEYNPFYDVSNNLVSLWNVRHHLSGGFILTNGDNLFEPEVVRRIASTPGNIVLGARKKPAYDDDDMKIALDPSGNVRAVNKGLGGEEISAESIGIMAFNTIGSEAMIEELCRMVRQAEGLRAYYLRAIEGIIERVSWPIKIADIGSLKWMEIDYPEDYELAQRKCSEFLPERTLYRETVGPAAARGQE